MAIIIFPEYMKLFISQQNLAKGKTNRSNSLAVCPDFDSEKTQTELSHYPSSPIKLPIHF